MHLQPEITVSFQDKPFKLPQDHHSREAEALSKLTYEQRQEVFEAIKKIQYNLPATHKTDIRHAKGLNFIEFPDGIQLEMEWKPFGCYRVIHQVSKDLYTTYTDARDALNLDLVEWDDLNEVPNETFRGKVEA